MSLCIAILSMSRLKKLNKSLKSYKENGLLDMADEKIIYFNKITNKDKEIAKKYGFKVLGDTKNIGVGKALIKLFEASTSKYIIFLENDWELIEDTNITKNVIETSITLLDENKVHYILYRHNKNPGKPFYIKHVINTFIKSNGVITEEIKSNWEIVRKVCRCHWFRNSVNFNNGLNAIVKPIKEYPGWYTSTNKYCSYTNNPYICNRVWWLNHLKNQNNVEGRGSEVNVQKHWYHKMDFKVGLNNGLFRHQ